MYIGPWQEYRLSQNQLNKSVNKKNNDEILRNQLLRAIQESLDPEAAAKAIEAIDKTLEKPRASDSEKLNLPMIPNQRRIRPYRRGAPEIAKTRLPHIAVYAYDADRESIPSHRSTRSEPIQGTKMIYTPDKRPPSHRESRRVNSINSMAKSDYDSNGVLDVLRLQKQEENKRAKPDFSGMWKWKEQSNGGRGIAGGHDGHHMESTHVTKKTTTTTTATNTTTGNGSKVSQVKRMHELYRENVAQPTVLEISDTPLSHNMQLSPIRHRSQAQSSSYQKPQTPVVKDKDLTTDDYHTVSKYFKLHSPKPFPTTQPTQSTQSSRILLSPVRDPPDDSSPQSYSHKLGQQIDPDNLRDDQYVDDQFSLSADQSLIQPSSPDGLLNWCATLNTDYIDDLY